MTHRDFYKDIKALHATIVQAIKDLMNEHGVDAVDLLGSNADYAYIEGYPGDGADVMSMEVSAVYLEDGKLMLDVVLDVDTEELAATNENGDIGDAYPCYRADDYTHIIACAGIEMVYESVYQVLEQNK